MSSQGAALIYEGIDVGAHSLYRVGDEIITADTKEWIPLFFS